MNQHAIILKAFDLILKHKIWEDKTPSEILKILMYLHTKGWLYIPVVDGKIEAIIAAYRIEYINDSSLVKIPVTEIGNTLYVPLALNLSDKSLYRTIRNSLKSYLEDNPNVNEIVFEELRTNKIKRHKLNKGASYGKQKRARVTSDTNISN